MLSTIYIVIPMSGCVGRCHRALLCLGAYDVVKTVLTGVPGENHRPATSHQQTVSHNVVSSTGSGFEITTLVVIGTDYIGSCKHKYHAITTTMVPAG